MVPPPNPGLMAVTGAVPAPPSPTSASWAARQPVVDVFRRLDTTGEGLTSAAAAARRKVFGANVVATHRVTPFGVLARQLRNPLLILLLSAAAIAAATGDTVDGVIIVTIVLLSVGLGFINEYRSELAVAALDTNVRHEAVVRRDGTPCRLDVRGLVPGDIVTLGVGDLVPADVRLFDVAELRRPGGRGYRGVRFRCTSGRGGAGRTERWSRGHRSSPRSIVSASFGQAVAARRACARQAGGTSPGARIG